MTSNSSVAAIAAFMFLIVPSFVNCTRVGPAALDNSTEVADTGLERPTVADSHDTIEDGVYSTYEMLKDARIVITFLFAAGFCTVATKFTKDEQDSECDFFKCTLTHYVF
mmetsp:Transcript_2949/g.5238  ORF Transcript_2949/g.5238 Transcript_2949/m.5238 type:complete len:110 (-) Transcript_2949:19-348(-)